MNKINFQKELDKIIDNLNGEVPKLFLHSCCAPCSSYTLEYLSNYFDITVYYFKPNISPKEEFDKRFAEQKRLIEELPAKHPIKLVLGEYDYNDFLSIAKGYEDIPEGGERCFRQNLQKSKALIIFAQLFQSVPLKTAKRLIK